jgi:hypothetical protein
MLLVFQSSRPDLSLLHSGFGQGRGYQSNLDPAQEETSQCRPSPTTPPLFISTLQATPTPLTSQSPPTTNTTISQHPPTTTATPANDHLQAQTAHLMNHFTPHEVLNARPAAAAHMTTAQNQDHNQDASALWSSVTTTSCSNSNSGEMNSNIGEKVMGT